MSLPLGAQAATVAGPGSAACPATSPLLLFLASVLSSILRDRQSQRGQQAESWPAADEYDYVVVGGGSAGSVLASRLSADFKSTVLLLERGGREPKEARVPGFTITNLDSAIAEVIRSEPEPQNCDQKGCVLNIPNVLGGGSTLNGMLYVRGAREDFDEWARLTEDDQWDYEHVLPFYKYAEENLDPLFSKNPKYHGRKGPQKVSLMRYRHPVIPLLAAALHRLGVSPRFDINAESMLGYSIIQTTSAYGERWSSFRSYVEPEQWRPNLLVETFATARKVVLEPSGSASASAGLVASGVEYMDAAGKVRVVRARKEVILTAGALHTPQLLMLSGIGPAQHLEELGLPVLLDAPGVGQNLMDHPDVNGISFACKPPLCVWDWESRKQDLREYNATRTGPLSTLQILHFLTFLRSSLATARTGNAPDLQFLFLGGTADSEENPSPCLLSDSWRINLVNVIVSLMRPESRGELRLNASDPTGPPIVRLNYFGDAEGHDADVVTEGLRLVMKLVDPLAEVGLQVVTDATPQCDAEGPFGSEPYLRCLTRARTTTAWHWSGTCRMGGPSDPDAVLDSRLRVRGVHGLRVADASAMPYITSGNTNAPTMMLAERAASFILQHH